MDAIEGQKYSLDEAGFLSDPGEWDRGFAETLAHEEGVQVLNDHHWRLIEYAREEYRMRGRVPMPPDYARHGGMRVKEIYDLFPKGPLSIHRLAGLPQPKHC